MAKPRIIWDPKQHFWVVDTPPGVRINMRLYTFLFEINRNNMGFLARMRPPLQPPFREVPTHTKVIP